MEVRLPRLLIDEVRGDTASSWIEILNRSPSPGESGAPRSEPIVFEAFELGTPKEGIDPASTIIFVDDALVWAGGDALAGWGGSQEVLGDGRLRVELTPDVDLASLRSLTVLAIVKTNGGDHDVMASWSFTVEDYVAPQLVAAVALGTRAVRLSFDADVSVADARFTLDRTSVPAVDVGVASATASGSAVDLDLDDDASPGATYRVIAEGVVDMAGNAIADGASIESTAFVPDAPDERRFDLWSMIPDYNRADDPAGDLRLLTQAWQEVVDLLLADIDRFGEIIDLERAPAGFIDLLIAQLGCPFDVADLDTQERRRLAAVLVDIYKAGGTAQGMIDVVRLFLGITIEIEPLGRTDMRLGTSKLNIDWTLGSDDLRVLHSFAAVFPVTLTAKQQDLARVLLEWMKVAREHVVIREPDSTMDMRWVLGSGELGTSTTLW